MAKTATHHRAVYEATESFVCEYEGVPVTVKIGTTTEEGSEMLRRYPHLFRPLRVNYPARGERIEQATAAPGEMRSAA